MAKSKGSTVSKKRSQRAASSSAPRKGTTPAAAPALSAKADVAPDVAVGALLVHSERLAKHLAAHADALATAKVTAKHGGEITALVASLRAAEAAWQRSRKAAAPGAVAAARDALTEGREDLFGALRAFADHDADTQRALDDLGGVDDDDDLDADVAALIPLARGHAADLKGTEITPAHVNRVEKALGAFRAARAGVRVNAGEETSAQALSATALTALRARNEAFWALSALNRTVCGRARFCFRRDPKKKALFSNYSAERSGARKRAAPAPAPAPEEEKKPTE